MSYAGDLIGAAAAVSGPQSTSVDAMDSKYRRNIADQSRSSGSSRTEHTGVPASGTDRRRATADDIIATKEVEVSVQLYSVY